MTDTPIITERISPAVDVSDRMDVATRQRLLGAADLAFQRYPGAVGELLRQELLSWMVFGFHLGSTLVMRVADQMLAEHEQISNGNGRSGPARQ